MSPTPTELSRQGRASRSPLGTMLPPSKPPAGPRAGALPPRPAAAAANDHVPTGSLPPGGPMPDRRRRRFSVNSAVNDLSISVGEDPSNREFDSSEMFVEHVVPTEGMTDDERSFHTVVAQSPRSRDVSRQCSRQHTPVASESGSATVSRRTSFSLPVSTLAERRDSRLQSSSHDTATARLVHKEDGSGPAVRHEADDGSVVVNLGGGGSSSSGSGSSFPDVAGADDINAVDAAAAAAVAAQASVPEDIVENAPDGEADVAAYARRRDSVSSPEDVAKFVMTQASVERDPSVGVQYDAFTDYGRLMPDRCASCASSVGQFLVTNKLTSGRYVVNPGTLHHEGVESIRFFTATRNMLHVPLPSLPGLDLEGSHEHNPYAFVGQCPAIDKIPCLRISRAAILPPKAQKFGRKHTLLLDLDETLVHSTAQRQNIHCDLEVRIPSSGGYGADTIIYVHYRPGVHEFLREVAKWYEVVVFTASLPVYADRVVDALDPDGTLIQHRMFRDSCCLYNGVFVKNLSYVGRDLSSLILVDNSPEAFAFQPRNGIPIISWFEDPRDRELHDYLPFMELLSQQRDVRPLLNSTFRVGQYSGFLREFLRLPYLQGDGVLGSHGV